MKLRLLENHGVNLRSKSWCTTNSTRNLSTEKNLEILKNMQIWTLKPKSWFPGSSTPNKHMVIWVPFQRNHTISRTQDFIKLYLQTNKKQWTIWLNKRKKNKKTRSILISSTSMVNVSVKVKTPKRRRTMTSKLQKEWQMLCLSQTIKTQMIPLQFSSRIPTRPSKLQKWSSTSTMMTKHGLNSLVVNQLNLQAVIAQLWPASFSKTELICL